MKRATIQELAANLGISRVSVWKALNNKPGVSADLRKRIVDEAVKIGYLKESETKGDGNKHLQQSRTIAVVVSRPESSNFWMQIIHQIAGELSLQNVSLLYTYLPSRFTEGDILPSVLSDGSVSGIIVLNVYLEEQLKMLAKLPMPKVFLDTVPTMPFERLDGDLVMIEGRDAVRKITGQLLDSDRKRLGFIGDINYAQTNMDRYQGFVDAFQMRGLSINESLNLTGSLHLTTHYKQISKFLNSLDAMPDGFVCASDYIANFVQQYFTEHEVDQERTCITGFDNNTDLTNVAGKITTVNVQTKYIGARLANKVLFAVNYPTAYHEACYISSEVMYRSY